MNTRFIIPSAHCSRARQVSSGPLSLRRNSGNPVVMLSRRTPACLAHSRDRIRPDGHLRAGLLPYRRMRGTRPSPMQVTAARISVRGRCRRFSDSRLHRHLLESNVGHDTPERPITEVGVYRSVASGAHSREAVSWTDRSRADTTLVNFALEIPTSTEFEKLNIPGLHHA